MDQGLDNRVVGGVHVGVEGEGALAVAVVGGVAVRGDDPVLPAQVPEAHIQRPLLTAHPPMLAAIEVSVDIIVFKIRLEVRIILLTPRGFRFLFLFRGPFRSIQSNLTIPAILQECHHE